MDFSTLRVIYLTICLYRQRRPCRVVSLLVLAYACRGRAFGLSIALRCSKPPNSRITAWLAVRSTSARPLRDISAAWWNA